MPEVSEADFVADLDIIPQVVAAAMEGPRRAAQAVIAFAMAAEQRMGNMGDKLMEAHSQVAVAAQKAVLVAYDAARDRSERTKEPYRTDPVDERNRRYAGGILREALDSAEFSVATEDGILFANTEMLNSRARQWHRLNFGAGQGGQPRTFQVTWGSMAAFSIGMEDEEPSPGFRLPAGYWIEPGGEFYPIGELEEMPGAPMKRTRRTATYTEGGPTRGIPAEEWLDAGVQRIAQLLPPAYNNVYREVFEEAKAAGLQKVPGTVTKLVRPTARGVTSRVSPEM